MNLNATGETVQKVWESIPSHNANVALDVFIVMPNHVHGIIILGDQNLVEMLHATSLPNAAFVEEKMSAISPKRGSLSAIVRSFKSAVTRQVRLDGIDKFGWQPRFYGHIIRDEKSLDIIRTYILGNPMKWESDNYYSP